jgi:homoserine dehydrogenase
VAKFGAQLLKIACGTGARYFFEASVGGGIPIIRPIYNCLAANKINQIAAILNGTTNFILTKMSNESLDFDDALKMAQELGYAEKDPSDDINGVDTCRKICILSSLAFGRQLPPEKVHTEGICGVTLVDIKNAESLGYKIKLIAKSREDHDSVCTIVAPMLVPRSSPLYNIDDVFNGIVVTGNAIGDVMFYGRGAGKLPTASAAAADVMDALAKHTGNITWDMSDGDFVSDYKYQPVKYYIRTDSTENNFFITEEFFEHELEEKTKNLNILSKIRLI